MVLGKSIRFLGLPSYIYTSHSFRIDRATELASKGTSNDNVKKLGRWASDVVDRYSQL